MIHFEGLLNLPGRLMRKRFEVYGAEGEIKLIDFGPDGVSGGGDDVDHEVVFDHTVMNTGSWVSIDVPLTDFTNLTTRANLAQMIISGTPNTVFLDNVYFYR